MTKLSSTVDIDKLKDLLKKSKQEEIADFIEKRFTERYFDPITNQKKDQKHGFSIMAVSCLVIESLESFKNGWETTRNRSEQSFKQFLTREEEFEEFKDCPKEFYKHIRCGILHQSETTGGWKIRRKGKLFDKDSKTINATKFLESLQKALKRYIEDLKKDQWDSELWDNLRRKLRFIIHNC